MQKKRHISLDDYLRASRRGNREAEQLMLGPGFHSHNRIHKSKKVYSRKRNRWDLSD